MSEQIYLRAYTVCYIEYVAAFMQLMNIWSRVGCHKDGTDEAGNNSSVDVPNEARANAMDSPTNNTPLLKRNPKQC